MATRKEINDEFYADYGDQPRSKTPLDYITPSSYVDPIAKAYAQQRMSDPISQMLAEQRFSAAPQDQAVAPAANRVSMSNLSGLTDYLPSMNTLSGLVPREIPNVFGQRNPLYEGLLGSAQSQALSKQSNIAGLLGAAAALVSGMGKQGGRRSAAQNIISALGAGYGSAGQQYQQGLQNFGQAQQLGIQQRQQAAIEAMKLKYPDYADEIAANPTGAFRLIAEREASAAAARGKTTTARPGDVVIDARGNVIYTAPAEAKPEKQEVFTGDYGNLALTMFGTARASELSDPQREALGKKAEQLGVGKGQNITTNINTGDFSKGTKGKIEENVLSSADAINRLNNVWSTYKPEYLNIGFRTKQAWSGVQGKFKDLNENDKKTLAGYSVFKQNSLQNVNQTIKALTGASMGVEEAARITASLPSAGTSVFDGDSPQEFEAKLTNALTQSKYSLARQNYALSQGINKNAWEKISLDDMPSIVLKRENELGKKYYGDKFNKNDVAQRTTIKRQLAAEFGIPF